MGKNKGDPHGPNKQSHYFSIHEKAMRDALARGFVLSENLTVAPFGNKHLTIQGTIDCQGDIEVTVEKILRILDDSGDPDVQTIEYHYNARIRGVGNIVRHDSPHPSHNQYDHVHRYDVFNHDEEGVTEKCEWPTLGQMLMDLEEWYYENREQFPFSPHG